MDTHPDELARGVDAQLDKAVEVLTEEAVQWKKTHPGIAHTDGGNPPVTTGTGVPSPSGK